MNPNPLIPISILILLSCSAPSDKTTDTETEPEKSTVPTHFIKKFKGTIDKYPITMTLSKSDTSITGEYYYDKFRLPIYVRGSYRNDSVSLLEVNPDSQPIAEFSGLLSASGVLEGKWTNLTNQKALPFYLTENYDEAARLSVENPVNRKCFKVDDPQIKAIYNQDSLCNVIDISFFTLASPATPAAESINRSIKKNICNLQFYEARYSSIDEILNMANEPEGPGFSFWIVCEPLLNDNDILSYKITQTSYSLGANHPLTNSYFYNLEISTGNLISLDDLLLPGYEGKLAKIGEAFFIKQNGSEGWNFEPDNFVIKKEFSLQVGGLVFSYDPYELGSYAMGAPILVIPYKELRELINPDGPIGNWK